ncbi:hypothetical protein SSX86_016982 [Deinandra increscens subsp. villosa]|uniref:PDZ domain-containing protein n=1 Tax=Deinandra increscens subsp. villosa TaxID=3103831 RepID=A0AAP0CZ96_9ASTR
MSTTTAIGAGAAGPATAFSTRNSYPQPQFHSVFFFFFFFVLQKSIFQGVSIQDAKRGVSVSFLKPSDKTTLISKGVKGLEIKARKTAGASKQIEVEVDKPLGLTLGPKPGSGGGVVITGVDGGGNAAKAGLKVGDQVIYTSSFFGDELWPADRLGFTKTAIQACPDAVYFVVSRGAEVEVKRLPKRPAPPRFGRKLTDAQKARATHICLDCGFIYTLSKPFEDQARFRFDTCFCFPDGYLCPQCRAPKKRFTGYDPATGKPIGGTLPPIGVIIGLVAGLAGVGALLVYGLQ